MIQDAKILASRDINTDIMRLSICDIAVPPESDISVFPFEFLITVS